MNTSRFLLFLSFVVGFLPGMAYALTAPLEPKQQIVDEQYDHMSVKFSWDKSVDPAVEWYHVVYQCKQNCSSENQGDAAWAVQPATAGRVSFTFVGGFDYSKPTKTTIYQWRVGACSAQASGDCAYITPPLDFSTSLQPAQPGGGDTGGDGGTPSTFDNPISAQNITELFSKVFSLLFGLSIFLVPVFVIYAAFLMLMGGGDPVKLQKGRMILLWTAIAFIIILLSKGLPIVFKNLL